MKYYDVKIKAYKKGGYSFEREFGIKASASSTAVSRAIKKFWSEPINKKRKRHTDNLWIQITGKM